ncbi:MAG: Ig-like domain-containing protein [candidate division WOR-3 bacterium]|nr:Ig-like domain-containing protein [candidate division WOR-3 bacterium]
MNSKFRILYPLVIVIVLLTFGCDLGIVDSMPPSVIITYPHNDDDISGTIDITVDAQDNVGVAHVFFKLEFTGGYSVKTFTDPESPYVYPEFNTTQYENGTRVTITATACDASGNAEVASIEVVIQN